MCNFEVKEVIDIAQHYCLHKLEEYRGQPRMQGYCSMYRSLHLRYLKNRDLIRQFTSIQVESLEVLKYMLYLNIPL